MPRHAAKSRDGEEMRGGDPVILLAGALLRNAAEMLHQAIQIIGAWPPDGSDGPMTFKVIHGQQHAQARRWFMMPNTGSISLADCCGVLNLDPEIARHWARRQIAKRIRYAGEVQRMLDEFGGAECFELYRFLQRFNGIPTAFPTERRRNKKDTKFLDLEPYTRHLPLPVELTAGLPNVFSGRNGESLGKEKRRTAPSGEHGRPEAQGKAARERRVACVRAALEGAVCLDASALRAALRGIGVDAGAAGNFIAWARQHGVIERLAAGVYALPGRAVTEQEIAECRTSWKARNVALWQTTRVRPKSRTEPKPRTRKRMGSPEAAAQALAGAGGRLDSGALRSALTAQCGCCNGHAYRLIAGAVRSGLIIRPERGAYSLGEGQMPKSATA